MPICACHCLAAGSALGCVGCCVLARLAQICRAKQYTKQISVKRKCGRAKRVRQLNKEASQSLSVRMS